MYTGLTKLGVRHTHSKKLFETEYYFKHETKYYFKHVKNVSLSLSLSLSLDHDRTDWIRMKRGTARRITGPSLFGTANGWTKSWES